MQRRWYWKAYFFLSALLVALGVGFALVLLVALVSGFSFEWLDESTVPEMIAGSAALPFYAVQLVGLYGFIYWRRFGYERLWQLVFAVTVIDMVWTIYSVTDDLPDLQGYETAFSVGMGLAGIILEAPLLVALFVYAFRSSTLWLTVSRA